MTGGPPWRDVCADAEPLWDGDPDDGIPARWRDLRGQITWRQIVTMTDIPLAEGSPL